MNAMPRRHRVRRVAKWFGAAVCAVVLIFWITNAWLSAVGLWHARGVMFFIQPGAISIGKAPDDDLRTARPTKVCNTVA